VDRFLAHPAERAAIAQTQRASIIERFSYPAGLGIMLDAVSAAVGVDHTQPVGGVA
jgi:hypothetical protein